jgi:hypothetical protein
VGWGGLTKAKRDTDIKRYAKIPNIKETAFTDKDITNAFDHLKAKYLLIKTDSTRTVSSSVASKYGKDMDGLRYVVTNVSNKLAVGLVIKLTATEKTKIFFLFIDSRPEK